MQNMINIVHSQYAILTQKLESKVTPNQRIAFCLFSFSACAGRRHLPSALHLPLKTKSPPPKLHLLLEEIAVNPMQTLLLTNLKSGSVSMISNEVNAKFDSSTLKTPTYCLENA